MKKEIKVVAIVLVALIVFLGGFGLGASKGINITIDGDLKLEGAAGAVNAGATQATTQPTTAPTTAPTQAPSGGDTTTAPSGGDTTTEAPKGDAGKIPSTPAEIAAAYNKAINDTKNYKGAVHVNKVSTIAIEVTECPGGNTVLKIIQPIVDGFTGTTTKDYDYNNGVDTYDANSTNLYDRITPGGRDAKLTEAGIASASATAEGDGYKMTIKLVAEKSSFDGTNTVNPVNHESIMDPLNLATLDIPLEITAADMDYPGATVEATVDGQGRLTKLSVVMPLDGSGTGKAAFIEATVGLAGSLDDVYTLTY